MLMLLQGGCVRFRLHLHDGVHGHDKALALHQDEAKNGSGLQVKQYTAEKPVIILRHRATADNIAKALFP